MVGRIPQTILITGVHGQLGRALALKTEARGLGYKGSDIDTLDISDPTAVDGWVDLHRPHAVINCAAFTAVDDCETEEEKAAVVNATAVGHLAAACDRAGARLIQISTDYVFAGDSSLPLSEDAAVGPKSAYGRTKLRGEQMARSAREHLVVRTAWLYGRGGRNFVEAIRKQILNGSSPLKVVSDQRGSPTFCDDLAEAVLDLIAADATGTVHATNAGETNWHGFAVEIAKLLGSDVEIKPVTTSAFPRPAPRPAYSVLDISRLESLISRRMPSWQDALARYLDQPCGS